MGTVLVTGGCGYIGSHTALALLEAKYKVIVYDNLSNASAKAIDIIEHLSKREVTFIEGDIRDEAKLEQVFSKHKITGVMHFAGLKSVKKAEENPLDYHDNNVSGSITLFKVMKENGVKTIVFSSSATVYGNTEILPMSEKEEVKLPQNPYGASKFIVENILSQIYRSDNLWNIILLRYFNPVGAHRSGMLGENPNGSPNNLMPLILQAAAGQIRNLSVFGKNYDTADGTCIRDYIHVLDLASGHISALKKCEKSCGIKIVNLGTGKGASVLQVIEAFERVNGVKVPYKFSERREGDVAVSYADVQFAKSYLGWKANFDLEEMCRDSWNHKLNNL